MVTCDSPPAGRNVLIVEDHQDIAETMALLLRSDGHAVRVATDGRRGLTEALTDPPDVVLLDIGLPGLSGWQLARRLRQALPGRAPLLVAVTGYDRPEDRAESERAGIDMHLAKPVDPSFVRWVLRNCRPTAQH